MKKTEPFLTSPRFVKFCVITGFTIWMLTIILGILVGQLDQSGPGFDLAGFNPLINYISDLGSLRYTPLPVILNFGMMATGLLMIPVSFAIKNILIGDGSKIGRKIMGYVTLAILLIGMAGFFFTGVLSEDTGALFDQMFPLPGNYPWHDIVADFAFIFFMASGILVASQFILFKDVLEKDIQVKNPRLVRIILIIITWILTPTFFGFFYTVPYFDAVDTPFWSYLPMWQWSPLWEWLLMLSIVASLFSVSFMIIKPLNRKMLNENEKS